MEGTRLILKNTLYLYARQFLVMLVALFTTRVILNSLGIDDFGLYNLIAGVVTMLSILTSSMTSATQRFLSISLGNDAKDDFQEIFNVCTTLFLFLSVLILLIAETVGLWFVNWILNIPENRMVAANWVFQLAIITFIIELLRIPYNAAIIAYEKMDFFAWVSIIQAILNLFVAYSIALFSYDHLIVYSILSASSSAFINVLYSRHCRKKLCIRFTSLSRNPKYFKEIFSFSFWSLFGSFSTIGTKQGMNILINKFFGVRLNASTSIATKVSGFAFDFVGNFTTAYRPQILKSYAKGDDDNLYLLLYRMTKLSSFLFMIIIIPLQLNLDAVLCLWLGVVPEYAAVFCNLLLIYLFIDALQYPLVCMVHAIGNIKRFQLTFSVLYIMNLPCMWLLLQLGYPSSSIYYVFIVSNVITSIYRVLYVRNRSKFVIKDYAYISIRIVLTFLIAYGVAMTLPWKALPNSWLSLFESVIPIVIVVLFTIMTIGVTQSERDVLLNMFLSKVRSFRGL